MTCGAAASLTISLKALMCEGDECIVFAPFFTEYRVFIENAGGKVVVSKPNEGVKVYMSKKLKAVN
jgi:aspartate aminotransferase